MKTKNYSEFINESNDTYADFLVVKSELTKLLAIEFEEYNEDEEVEFQYKKNPYIPEDRIPKDPDGKACYDYRFVIHDELLEIVKDKLDKFARKYSIEVAQGETKYLTGPFTSIHIRFKIKDLKVFLNEIH